MFRKSDLDGKSIKSGFSKSRQGGAPSMKSGQQQERNLKHYIFQGMDNDHKDIISQLDKQKETPDSYLLKEFDSN